jgi:hypothetical protein
MSQENVDLVAEGLREFQATLRATERAAADFVWDLSTLEGWPDATEYFGPEGFNEFVAKWTAAYDEFEQRTGRSDRRRGPGRGFHHQPARPSQGEANPGSISGSASSGPSPRGN